MTFSDAILLMDVSPLWAILFFFMLILLGIDSEFGTLEGAIGPIMDLKIFPNLRKELVTFIVAVVLFLFGLSMVSSRGFYIFQMFDDYSVIIPLLVIALFQCIGVAWVYGNERYALLLKRLLHGRMEMGNFFLSVKKCFTSVRSLETIEIFFNTRREFGISKQSCIVLFTIKKTPMKYQTILLNFL